METLRATKIVATVSPHSDILAFARAGADIFRINASHGHHDEYISIIRSIRDAEAHLQKIMPLWFDLSGPKFRIGRFLNHEITLLKDDLFILDLTIAPGDQRRVSFLYPELFSCLKKDQILLLNDGQISLKILSVTSSNIMTQVLVGGVLSDCKGVNIPNQILPIPFFTEKDKQDLAFALHYGVTMLGLSFVQTPDNIRFIRSLIPDTVHIVTKIEKPSAIEYLDEIIQLSDTVVVARGDLGVEMGLENVPWLQSKIIQAGRRHSKPVIVATQMMESMIHAPFPTRAEVSDVANAVKEGAHAVALSAESATGQYPLHAISMMARIICAQEKNGSKD